MDFCSYFCRVLGKYNTKALHQKSKSVIMKKLIFSFSLALLSVLSVQAQLLWRVTAPGNEAHPSYLFGTHHVAPVSILDSVAGFTAALNSVDAVYGEMDMEVASSQESTMVLMSMAAAPADSTLSALFAPSQLDSIQAACNKYLGGVSVEYLDGLKPVMVANMIGIVQNQLAFPGRDDMTPVDDVIQRRARAAGKEVVGLETIEQQCQALMGAPIIEQAENLMSLVRDDEESISLARSLGQAYLEGDLNKILEIIESSESGMSASDSERLINSRNADWLRILAGLIPAASIMIAVGAGHLPGDKGLLEGLKKEGFKVEPVK